MRPDVALALAVAWAAACLAGFVFTIVYAVRASRR